MKHLVEALSKSKIKSIKTKNNNTFIVWPRWLPDEFTECKLTVIPDKWHIKYYTPPVLYVLDSEQLEDFKKACNRISKTNCITIYKVNKDYGNIDKFIEEYKNGNIVLLDYDFHHIPMLDLVYTNREK